MLACVQTFAPVFVHIGADMCMGMHVKLHTDMRVNMCANIWMDTSETDKRVETLVYQCEYGCKVVSIDRSKMRILTLEVYLSSDIPADCHILTKKKITFCSARGHAHRPVCTRVWVDASTCVQTRV